MLAKQSALHLPPLFLKLLAAVTLAVGNVRYGVPYKDGTPP